MNFIFCSNTTTCCTEKIVVFWQSGDMLRSTIDDLAAWCKEWISENGSVIQKTEELQNHKVIINGVTYNPGLIFLDAFLEIKRCWHETADDSVQITDDILPNQRGYRWCLLPGRRRPADQLQQQIINEISLG